MYQVGEGAQIRDRSTQVVPWEVQSGHVSALVGGDAVPGRDGLVGQPGVVLRPVGAVGCMVESDQRVPLLARVRDDRGFRGGGVSVGRPRARCAVGVYGADGVMEGRAGRKLAVRVGRASQVAVVQLLPAVDAVPRPEFVRDRTGDGIPAELDRAGRLGLGGQQRRGQGGCALRGRGRRSCSRGRCRSRRGRRSGNGGRGVGRPRARCAVGVYGADGVNSRSSREKARRACGPCRPGCRRTAAASR